MKDFVGFSANSLRRLLLPFGFSYTAFSEPSISRPVVTSIFHLCSLIRTISFLCSEHCKDDSISLQLFLPPFYNRISLLFFLLLRVSCPVIGFPDPEPTVAVLC